MMKPLFGFRPSLVSRSRGDIADAYPSGQTDHGLIGSATFGHAGVA
jgi:hypothetical protein